MKRILPEWVFDVIGWMICGGLMTIYLPMYALGYLTIRKNIAKLKLLKFLGFKSNKAKLGLVSRRSRVTDISEVSAEEEIDFQSHRSLGYVHRMTLWTPKEIVKAILGRQKLNLISDEQLAYVILATTFSHAVKWDEKRKMFCLSMLELQNYFLFQGFYWDARQIFVDADGSRIIIQMDDGSEFSSDCEPAQRSDYKLAKLHAQVCLSYFAPGLSHNYVHFVFPSAVCVLAKNKLNHQSTLYKLLSPHFRFTERINYQALKVGKATSNRQTLIDRFFFFWQPFPITREQFVENVAVKCKNYYHECGSPDYRTELRTKSGTRLPSVVEEDNTERNHFLFPPAYVTKKDMQKLPYMAFLAEYYFVVRRFVKAMEPFIDKSEWEMLAEEISVHVPRFNQVNMVDAIATFIHQVGVVHFCDHDSYVRYFAYKYGCMTIRAPFESFESEDHWKNVCHQMGLELDAVKKDPLLLLSQTDIMRARCFINLFVDYIPNPDLDLRLTSTEYKFDQVGPQEAAMDFLAQLEALDSKLKKEKCPINIPANRGEPRSVGAQITRLNDMIRSVCF